MALARSVSYQLVTGVALRCNDLERVLYTPAVEGCFGARLARQARVLGGEPSLAATPCRYPLLLRLRTVAG